MKLVRICALLLCVCMMFSLCPAQAFAAEMNIDEEMTDVLIYETEDKLIYVTIPTDQVDAYMDRIQNDPAFLQSEINEVLSYGMSRAYGAILFEEFMYKSDIEAQVDAWSGTGTFINYLSDFGGVLPYSQIDILVGMTGLGTACEVGCTILCCALSVGAAYQESWWKTSLQYIVNGDITAVRYRIYESTTEYPKVYRVFDRI